MILKEKEGVKVKPKTHLTAATVAMILLDVFRGRGRGAGRGGGGGVWGI